MTQPLSVTMPDPIQAQGGLMARLRQATDAAHRRLETRLDVEACLRDRARYADLLWLFYGIYRPLEHCLEQAHPQGIAGLELAARRKAPWLAQDFRALGLQAPEEATTDLPPLETEAQGLGCLYVLEGSTLGGQMIARMLARELQIGLENGGRFFHGYGSETGVQWRIFGAAAEQARLEAEDIVAAANATFAAFEGWAARHSTFSR